MDDSTNPYAAPQSLTDAVDPNSVNLDLTAPRVVRAGQGARFVNLIVDYAAQMGLGFVFGLLVGILGGEAGIRLLNDTPGIVIGLPIALLYFIVMEATTSRTVGKLLTGTKVVNDDGGKPTIGQIVGRTFARFIPFEAFSFLHASPRGWHDSLSKTNVVKA